VVPLVLIPQQPIRQVVVAVAEQVAMGSAALLSSRSVKGKTNGNLSITLQIQN
jgi:hypothetical protein